MFTLVLCGVQHPLIPSAISSMTTKAIASAGTVSFVEVKAEARSSRDFSRELGDFFDGLGPAAYAQEAPPVDDESDDETKTPS